MGRFKSASSMPYHAGGWSPLLSSRLSSLLLLLQLLVLQLLWDTSSCSLVVNAKSIIHQTQQLFPRHLQQEDTDPSLFLGCSLEEYYDPLILQYGNVLVATRTDIHQLLQDTHRYVLPYTDSNSDDVWKALMDLDPGIPIVTMSGGSDDSSSSTTTNEEERSITTPTVHLIYADIDVNATAKGTPDTWNREHLWPKSHGVGQGGPDFTDIHHLRPSDWNVNSARNNLYFGQCGLVKDNTDCRQPATAEAASDTALDGMIFLPPLHRRGDIARALFYMDLRYEGTDGGVDLELTDCPPNNNNSNNQMAYLSQLLEWHGLDPVDDEERIRNDKACSRWQGNRNVFVDYPELVQIIYGVPYPITLGSGDGYPFCPTIDNTDDNNSQPTTPGSGEETGCSGLNPGDVPVIAFDSDDPDMVALVALEDLPAGLELYMTDNAWTGNGFLTNEGTIMMTVPQEGIAQGTVFGYGLSSSLPYANQWQSSGGRLALSASGDAIIIYCINQTDEGNPVFNHLGAISYANVWSEPGAATYDTNESALPAGLDNGNNGFALPHFDNYVYQGVTSGTKMELQTSLSDRNSWFGSNVALELFLGEDVFFEVLASGDGRDDDDDDGNSLGFDPLFVECSLEEYYIPLVSRTGSSDISSWSRAEVHQLLQETHRNILPYTSSNRPDVWSALVDLDPGVSGFGSDLDAPTVQLIYADIAVNATDKGTASTWNREHLWPKSRGVGNGGPDFTDIHHLRPSDWNVNAVRSNLNFGACGLFSEMENCRQPAAPEAADDTAKDGAVFLPPANRRGDVARALFYMDLRYEGTNGDTDLELTDCPNSNDGNRMAYLSQLLEWHVLDPPDDKERIRNNKACGRWQGNRNIFVDYPDLAQGIYGDPQSMPLSSMGYPSCNRDNDGPTGPTTAPVTIPTNPPPNEGSGCSGVSPGDVSVIGFDSDNPDMVAFVALEDLPAGLELGLTDNAWTGDGFLTNEGTVTLAVSSEGIKQGTVFGYGVSSLPYSSEWKSSSGSFALSASGDSIVLFCIDQDAVNPLSAIAFGTTGWSEAGAASYETSESALPPGLISNGIAISLALPHFDNYRYIGVTNGTKSELQSSLGNSTNWSGSNEAGQLSSVSLARFTVVASDNLNGGDDEPPHDAAVGIPLWMPIFMVLLILWGTTL